jgi:hypothetical protein
MQTQLVCSQIEPVAALCGVAVVRDVDVCRRGSARRGYAVFQMHVAGDDTVYDGDLMHTLRD